MEFPSSHGQIWLFIYSHSLRLSSEDLGLLEDHVAVGKWGLFHCLGESVVGVRKLESAVLVGFQEAKTGLRRSHGFDRAFSSSPVQSFRNTLLRRGGGGRGG